MSTIKVTNIEHASTGNGGIQLDNAGHVTVDGVQMPTAGPLSNRNMIINGSMNIAQRGDDFQPPTSGDYTLDRFQAYMSSSDAYDVQKVSDVPSGEGFKASLKVTSNAATSVAAGGYYYLGQKIEGNNWVQMAYGSSGAKTCTVSFWVKSSLTGTHSGIFKNDDQTRSLAFEYTISSANTWEYKQITISGDTSGTWLTGSGIGVWVYFSMGVGTTFGTGTANTWQGSNLVGTTGSVDLVATSGATWFLTGLQVEQGDKATPFEHRSFSDELCRCQRYFCRSYAYGTATGSSGNNGAITSTAYGSATYASAGTAVFPVEMRATPAVTIYGTGGTLGKVNADSGEGTGQAAFINSRHAFLARNNDGTGVAVNVYLKAHYTAAAEL